MNKEKPKSSIKTQFLFRFLFMGIFIVAVFVVLMMYSFNQNRDKGALRTVEAIEGIYQNLIANDIKMLSAGLESFATNAGFKEVFEKKDRAALQQMADELFRSNRDKYGITHFYFIDDAGVCFLRMHKPDFFGDAITRTTYKEAKEKQHMASGVELGKTAYALRVIWPYMYKEKLLGYVEFGEEIDHFDQIIKQKMGSDVIILGDKKFLDKAKYDELSIQGGKKNNWNDLKDYVVLSDTLEDRSYFLANIFNAAELKDVNDPIFLGTHHYGDRILSKGAFPFHDAEGKHTGIVYVLTDITEQVSQYRSFLLYIILIGIALFIFFLGLSLRYFHVKVFKPISELAASADKISVGEDLDKEILSDRNDEIGVLTRSFDRMRISLNKLMLRLSETRKNS